MKFKILSVLILVSLLASSTSKATKPVIIMGTSSSNIFKEFQVDKPSYSKDTANSKKQGESVCQFDIDTVEIRELYSRSEGNCFYAEVFVTPGDSISFEVSYTGKAENPGCENHYEIIFHGKNAAHYNYYSKKEKHFPSKERLFYEYGNDLDTFKQQQQLYRDREIQFLLDYKKQYPISEDFFNYANAEIQNSYAFKLYQAVYISNKNPNGYLDDVVIKDNPLSFWTIETLYFKYIYDSSDENIECMYEKIKKEVNSTYRTRVLTTFIKFFSEKGENIYREPLLRLMNQIEQEHNDSTLLACVQEYKPYPLLLGKTLPDSVLDNIYLRSFETGEKITLRNLFEKYQDKAIYIDTWASWCKPCRDAIKGSTFSKSYLTQKNISTVYLSMDDDEKAWLHAIQEDGITENQYILDDNSVWDSPFMQFFKINSIPRYILFNKYHEIEVLSAPGQTERFFEKLKTSIERLP